MNFVEENRRAPEFHRKNRTCKHCAFYAFGTVVVVSMAVVLLVYFITFDVKEFPDGDEYTCTTQESYRVLCGPPEMNITYDECISLQCCFDDVTLKCFHYIPSKYNYMSSGDGLVYRSLQSKTTLGRTSYDEMKISIVEVNEYKVQIILHEASTEFEEITLDTKNYKVEKYTNFLGVDVFRNMEENSDRILSTTRGPLIASNGYWEWSVQLTLNELYGLGQLGLSNSESETKVVYKNSADHDTIPVFLAHQNGLFHGLHVEHEGPLEVTILLSKLIVIKSLAGNSIKLNLFTGTTPKDVIMKMRSYEFVKPPRWSLGAHLCRKDQLPRDEIIEERNEHKEITYESDCFDENLVMYLYTATQEESDAILEEIVIIKNSRKFILSIPPQIPIDDNELYVTALEKDVLYKYKSNVLNGTYLDKQVAYLDFSAENIQDWMNDWIVKFQPVIELSDGFAFTDNWPAQENYNMTDPTKYFSYLTNELILAMSNTLNWDAPNSKLESHHKIHNDYGKTHFEQFKSITENKLTMMASYQYGVNTIGMNQNVNISWTNLKKTISNNLYHSLLLHPLVSSPVCGSDFFAEEKYEAICIRWFIMAATLPFFRVAGDWPLEATGVYTGYGRDIALDALNKRDMLSYYYYNALDGGEPLIRPMFYDYYQDNETLLLDEQYMVGENLLVAQSTSLGVTVLRVYLPPAQNWYEFWGGLYYGNHGWTDLHFVESDWITFVKAGSIVPLKNKIFIEKLAVESFSLVVAFDCIAGEEEEILCHASGVLQFDGILRITADHTQIRLENIQEVKNNILADSSYPYVIEHLKLYGGLDCVQTVNFNLKTETEDAVSIELLCN